MSGGVRLTVFGNEAGSVRDVRLHWKVDFGGYSLLCLSCRGKELWSHDHALEERHINELHRVLSEHVCVWEEENA